LRSEPQAYPGGFAPNPPDAGGSEAFPPASGGNEQGG